jgi:hypothetical protein
MGTILPFPQPLKVKNNALERKSSGQFDGNSWRFYK